MISHVITLMKLTSLMLLIITETNSAQIRTPSTSACQTSCGTLTIPFPFGTSSDCSLDESFLINCNNHNYDPPKPFLNPGSIEVLDISLDGLMKVASSIASDCYDESGSGSQVYATVSDLTLSHFPISSTRNKFTAIGCDTYALVEGSEEWKQMSAGCVSWCDSIDCVVNGACSRIGCCQTSIPKGLNDFLVDIPSFRHHTRVTSFNPYGYAFVVEPEAFEFWTSDLKDLRNKKTVPVVLDWSVGNVTCQEARKNLSSYACQSIHGECKDSSNGVGYHCHCLKGFEGNPYLLDGCRDVDECSSFKPCQGKCMNLLGSSSCSTSLFYIVSGFMIPAVGISWLFWRRKQKKEIKLRETLFKRNGGSILEHMLSGLQEITLRIFRADDLRKATNNYSEDNVVLRDRSGITYKGIVLLDGVNHQVTIKKYEVPDGCIDVFIGKLFTLSQINHMNVVKLIGCCLETHSPLLVYNSIVMQSLHDYIHNDALARSISWDIRLRIAAQTAGALASMHSAAAVPIIHGNINSSSILLNSHDYMAKVHDFSLFYCSESSNVRFYIDSIGYMDPECCVSGRLTMKSDVYSFGVVLAELLTGMQEVSYERLPGEELLAKYFVSSVRGDNLMDIVDRRFVSDGKIEQLKEVAKIAVRCLSESSEERPTMTQVVIELQSAINIHSSTSMAPPTILRTRRRNRSL